MRILIADDHEIVRQGLRLLVDSHPGWEVCGEAADGWDSVRKTRELKPDVIALELDISGRMAGKDVINMIKATMEWVDIPILLYTRLPLESQKEARTVHGADDLVLKRSGPAALVARVIMTFRRGS